MKILIANLGSTSFKYALYSVQDGVESLLTKGGYERVENHAKAIEDALKELTNSGEISSPEEIEAVGFKTVLGRNLSGCVEADQRVVDALEGFSKVAPAHNPPYAEGIRQFSRILPKARLVALFETAFYQWMPEAATRYAVPQAWHDLGVRRYGFHGASHKFIAERSAELMGRHDVAKTVRGLYSQGFDSSQKIAKPLRVVSCHLGGSSSVTGICNGVAIGSSMGFSPQSGLPQNNRVGDLDAEAIPFVMNELGISVDEIRRQLTKESGLLGLSEVSNDVRDITQAAESGNAQARIALDVLIHSIRHWVGAFAFQMGGIDALVFTAGIGENHPWLREEICAAWHDLGFKIDPAKNKATVRAEGELSAENSNVKIFLIPANEELVLVREVFRKAQDLAQKQACPS